MGDFQYSDQRVFISSGNPLAVVLIEIVSCGSPEDLLKGIRRCAMTVKEAVGLFKYHLQANHKKRTIESHRLLPDKFNALYAGRKLEEVTPDEIFHFLETLSGNLSKATRRLRYAQMKAFYNFIIDRCSLNWRNPCNTTLLSISFFTPFRVAATSWSIRFGSP